MAETTLAERLELLNQYVRDLQETQPSNFAAYENDKMLRRYVERLLHMTIDTCIQIGIGVLTQAGWRAPENYHDVFIVLGEHEILPSNLVDSMTALVEFRNELVYEHNSVDDMMVYGVLKKRLDEVNYFSQAVQAFLAR